MYKYTGQQHDLATGLYYYGARYYDTSTGRFISRDPAGISLSDPQSLSVYSYTRNNPEVLIDPTGKGAYYPSHNWLVRTVAKWAFYGGIVVVSCCWAAIFGQPQYFFLILGIVIGALGTISGTESRLLVAFFFAFVDFFLRDFLKPQLGWWGGWIADAIANIVAAIGWAVIGYYMYTARYIRSIFGGKAVIFYWGMWAAVDFAIEWGFDYLGWWRDF